LFVSRRKYNGQNNLWQIKSGGGQPDVIATGSERLGHLAVSPDRQTVAFVEESYDTNIWRIEPARAAERRAFRKFAASSQADNSPHVSPDGSRVVFASSRTGRYEIWIADADGSNARKLTDIQNGHAGSPRFSPDGRWIIFDAQVEGNGDIFIISANGGEIRRVTDSPAFDYIPAWSADGSSIYFVSNRTGEAQIYKMPAAGGEAKQITTGGGGESYESPDGKSLYYRKGGSTALWLVSFEQGGEQIVAELADAGHWRYWTVTKTGIYFVPKTEYPPYKIMFYDFSINRAREITEVQASPISVYPGLGASADGKLILYAQNDQNTSSIMLAELGK
jgi:Tol biopolymer transport system component